MSSYTAVAHVHKAYMRQRSKRCPGFEPTYAAQQSIPT
jgi:hypothetical protein